MPTYPIQLKRSGTASATPSSLVHGELAINYNVADGKLFWKDSSNVIQSFTFQAYALSSHSHGNITNAGAIGSTANLPIITTTSGVLTTGSFGTTAATFCEGNDSRLSDTRTPTDGSVTTAKLANDAVTYAKLQNVSATDRLLGRSSAGAGDVEEILCGSFGRSLIGSADSAAARTTLSVQPTASPAFTGTVTAAAVTLSGVLLVTTGSASAPGVAFSGDPDTGIAQLSAAGANTLSLIAGGTERFRVNGNGETVSAGTFVAPSGDTSIRGSGAGVGQWLGICGDAAGFGTGPAIIMRSAGAGGSTEFYSGSSQGVIINSSRQLLVTAGSGSAGSYKPGVAVSGDDDTGLQQVGGAGTISLVTQGSERVRVDASGNVGIGAAANAIAYVHIDQTAPSSGAVTQVIRNTVTIPSATTSGYWTFLSAPTTQAASFTLTNLRHFVVDPQSFGAGSTVTNQFGYIVEASLTGATNNYGFYSNIGDAANRWNFYAAGSAKNYFNGETLIGTTTDNGAYLLQVNSQIYATNATIATSDARFKTNVEQLTDATSVIEALRPVAFDFIPHEERNFATERQVGLIAQEAQSALAGTDYADSVVAQCGDHLGLAYEKLVPVLVRALQESNARIAALEERLNHA